MSTSNTLRSRVSRETRQLLAAALIALARTLGAGPHSVSRATAQPESDPLAAFSAVRRASLCKPRRRDYRASEPALDVHGSPSVSRPPDDIAEADPATVDGHAAAKQRCVLAAPRRRSPPERTGCDRRRSRDGARRHSNSRRLFARRCPALDAVFSQTDPRYFMATVGTPAGVSLRPVLVGSLHEIRSPAWPGPIWSVPEGTDLDASAFVFTTSGEIAGLVVREPNGLAIVPWDIVVAEGDSTTRPGTCSRDRLAPRGTSADSRAHAGDRCRGGRRRGVGRFTRASRQAGRSLVT